MILFSLLKDWSRRRLSPSIREALRLQSMREGFAGVRQRQQESISRIVAMEDRRKRLFIVREQCVNNQALLSRAVDNLRANRFKVHLAASSEDAVQLVLSELDNERIVVKSKSNATKEIRLAEKLAASGIEVVETDIGDRVIQLGGEKPSHPTVPAIHLSSEEIGRLMSQRLGVQVESDPVALSRLIARDIDAAIEKTRIGITGANAIAAEEGMVAVLHNEGNIWKVMMRPRKHIILAGIDKIYPNLDEVINLCRVQTFYGTGQVAPAFINIIGGPSRTADIQGHLVIGVHGPQEVTLILVDNGRQQLAQSNFRELLYCIGCGACLLECPSYALYGHEFGYSDESGGRGAVKGAVSEKGAARRALELCLNCGRCRKICPLEIDVPGMAQRLREMSTAEEVNHFLRSHLRWIGRLAYIESLLLLATLLKADE